MFKETCNQLKRGTTDRFFLNLLLESLAIHTRVLVDFFYAEKKYQDDIIAQDFLEDVDWEKERPEINDILSTSKNRTDKQLAHLTTDRIRLIEEGKNGWNYQKIEKDIDLIFEKFNKYLKK